MFSTDRHHRRDRHAARAAAGIGVVRLSGPSAPAIAAPADRRSDGAARAAPRDVHDCPSAPPTRRTDRSGRRHLFPRAGSRTPARTSSRSARTAARSCCERSSPLRWSRRAARRARRVHAARVSERADRSDAGRSRRRSRRCGDAAAGARRVRSTAGHADAARSRDSMRRCSI